jgi:hypothetical protein
MCIKNKTKKQLYRVELLFTFMYGQNRSKIII